MLLKPKLDFGWKKRLACSSRWEEEEGGAGGAGGARGARGAGGAGGVSTNGVEYNGYCGYKVGTSILF